MSGEFSWAQDTSLRYGLQLYYNIQSIDNGRGIMSYTFYIVSTLFLNGAHLFSAVVIVFSFKQSLLLFYLSLFFTPVYQDIDSRYNIYFLNFHFVCDRCIQSADYLSSVKRYCFNSIINLCVCIIQYSLISNYSIKYLRVIPVEHCAAYNDMYYSYRSYTLL